jgi:pimeloyl-ACP methyl ester carboxylesterase
MALKRAWSGCRRHPKGILGGLVASGFIALNAVAFVHARAMTHFTEGGARTERPEKLTAGEKLWTLLTGVNIPKPRNGATPDSVGLEFETRAFSSGDVPLEAWHVPVAQSRGLVLLFHGYASSKASLLPQARFFHDLGYETLLVDFRGCGGSSGNVTTLGVYEADDVAAAIREAAHLSPRKAPILYGTSMGSVAILRAIHVHGLGPKSIVIECPFGRLIDTVKARFALVGVPAFPAAQLLVFWGGVQLGFLGLRHDPVDYAQSVRCPSLLLHGEADPTISLEQVKEVFANLGGPKALRTFPGVGHEGYLAKRPDEWRAIVAEFLR